MTRRGALTLLLGVATYGAAWLFGAKALYPAATGLVLAPLLARAWVRLAASPIQRRRKAGKGVLLEGEDVWVTLEARPETRVPLPSLAVTEKLARIGERETCCGARAGSTAAPTCSSAFRAGATSSRRRAPRSTTRSGSRRRTSSWTPGGSLVYPRLVVLDRLFSESGLHAQEGRCCRCAARPASTSTSCATTSRASRCGRCTMPDRAARSADGEGARGRAAGRDRSDPRRRSGRRRRRELRRAGTRGRLDPARARPHGRRAVLAVNSARQAKVHVSSLDGDWHAALAVLAEAEADGARPVVELVARESGPPRAPWRSWSSRPASLTRSRRNPCSARSPARASASSGSTRPVSSAGRRSSSPSCCACRRPGSRSPFCAAAIRSRRCSEPLPPLGARMARTIAALVPPAPTMAIAWSGSRSRRRRRRLVPGRPARARASAGAEAAAAARARRSRRVDRALLGRPRFAAGTRRRSTTARASSSRSRVASRTASRPSSTWRCRSTATSG